MTTTAEILIREAWTIAVIVRNGRSPAKDHIQALARPDRNKYAFLRRSWRGPRLLQTNQQEARDTSSS